MAEQNEEYVLHKLSGFYFVTYERKQGVAWGIGTTPDEAWEDARAFISFSFHHDIGLFERGSAFHPVSTLKECRTDACTKSVLQYISAYGGDRFLKVAYRDKQGIWRIKQV